ncbi:hypothetical protein [Polaromonas sp.]|uniref:hypothetical protein n=1 Tax=Polaromonas sp. TaxID=1869339 RepID=UPI0024894F71|nr:hypothetical protein [Polaromonas sp.]MDI1274287.1 hypothetical protein [Polaromonas sp.]
MTWNRRKRLFIVLFALVNVVFMQLAMAAYACPGGGTTESRVNQAAALAAHAGMPCAESLALTMDDEQPSLCAAHCKADQQTADKYQLPALALLAAVASDYPVIRLLALTPSGVPLQAPVPARTTALSVAVRHCCFRL